MTTREIGMRKYNPDKDPDPADWLRADESARIELIRAYHRARRLTMPKEKAHAVVHATVETQLAQGLPAVTGALARLRESGLDRHAAIHAIGSVLLEHLQALARATGPAGDPNPAYFAALHRLTAESWRRSG